MPYLIDGHNLIAHLPYLRLSDPDDEAALIRRLIVFCQRTRGKAHVYFDRGQPGSGRPAPRGGLTVHFVPPPRTADQALRAHLVRLGREAHNWTVVTSDAEVQAAAASAGARVLTCPEFARRLHPQAPTSEKPEGSPDPGEIARWETQFQRRQRDRQA